MTTSNSNNSPKFYAYHEFVPSDIMHIYAYKELDNDCTYYLLLSHDRPELSEKWDAYNCKRPLSLEEVKRYLYHPELFVTDSTYRPIELITTITLTGAEIDFYLAEHPDHIFYFNVGSMSGGNYHRLIEAYLNGLAEVWRMSRFDRMLALHITKICPVCDGAGKVQWTTGKRTIKRHVKTCPQCKGHNSLQIII